MQTICTSLQTDKHINTPSLNFYRAGALPDAHQQRQNTEGTHLPVVMLANVKSRLVLPFWYQLTQVVLKKGY